MEARKSVSIAAQSIFAGPYTPSPLRRGGELAHTGYKGIEQAFRDKRYASLVLWGGSVFFTISFFAFLFSLPSRSDASWGPTPYAPAAAIAEPATQTLELHIANNGLSLLKGARVSAVNGNIISVSTAWGSTNFTWTVRTNAVNYETRKFGTHFLDANGNAISIQDIRTGDYVTVTGTLDDSSAQPTLDATAVRKS